MFLLLIRLISGQPTNHSGVEQPANHSEHADEAGRTQGGTATAEESSGHQRTTDDGSDYGAER